MSQLLSMPAEVAEAVRGGHAMEWDPPAAMTATRRWTCVRCGNAVLFRFATESRPYGSATQESCASSLGGVSR